MNYVFYDYCDQCSIHAEPKPNIPIHHAKSIDDVNGILETYGNKATPWFYVTCDDETLAQWMKL